MTRSHRSARRGRAVAAVAAPVALVALAALAATPAAAIQRDPNGVNVNAQGATTVFISHSRRSRYSSSHQRTLAGGRDLPW